MDTTYDSRSFLECDDEYVAIDCKFAALEASLHKSCDLMEVILRKISKTKRQIEIIRRLNKPDCVLLLVQRLKMFKTLYKIHYEMSQQQADQLEFLHAQSQEDEEAVIFDGGFDDFSWRNWIRELCGSE